MIGSHRRECEDELLAPSVEGANRRAAGIATANTGTKSRKLALAKRNIRAVGCVLRAVLYLTVLYLAALASWDRQVASVCRPGQDDHALASVARPGLEV